MPSAATIACVRASPVRARWRPSSGALATERGIADRVEFVGPVAPDEVVDFYRSLDVLAVPSLPTRIVDRAVRPRRDRGDGLRGAGRLERCGRAARRWSAAPASSCRPGMPRRLAAALVEAAGPRAPELRARGIERAASECTLGRRRPRLPRPVPVGAARGIRARTPPSRSSSSRTAHPSCCGVPSSPWRRCPSPSSTTRRCPRSRRSATSSACATSTPAATAGSPRGSTSRSTTGSCPAPTCCCSIPTRRSRPTTIGPAACGAAGPGPTSRASGPMQVDESGTRRAGRVDVPVAGRHLARGAGARAPAARTAVRDRVRAAAARRGDRPGRRLDERFFLYAEETDWAYRAHRLGWRHAAVPDVRAVHVGAGTSGDAARREAHFHASQERYLRKHYGALGWQWARLGQWLGRDGPFGRAARRARARRPQAGRALPARAGPRRGAATGRRRSEPGA